MPKLKNYDFFDAVI